LIGTQGTTQCIFPLPIGKNIGKQYAIGLPEKCTCPELHSIRYSSEDKGFWVTFSATDRKTTKTKEAHVLLLEGESGKAAVVTLHEYKLQKVRNKLIDGYKEAKERGDFYFDTPLPCPELISTTGQTQWVFPLPYVDPLNEKNINIGKSCTIGLPRNCTSPEIHSIRYSSEDKGFWVTFSATDVETKNIETAHVLLLEGESGKAAVVTLHEYKLQKVRNKLIDGYKEAKEREDFYFDTPLPCPELISTTGDTQWIFPLPIGKNIGKSCTIGLPTKCTAPELHSIRYSSEDKGFWVTFSATDEETKNIETAHVLLLEGESGKAAVVTLHEYKLQKVCNKLIDGYKEAKERGDFYFDTPLPCPELIAADGTTQCIFPLPIGKNIGKQCPIGLPTECTSPELHSIRYSSEDKGFWVTFSATDKKTNKIETAHVLLLEDVSGKAAVVTFRQYIRNKLIDGYKEAKERGDFYFDTPLPCPELIGADGTTQCIFPLPIGKNIGKRCPIGLQKNCTSPELLSIRYSSEDKGFWVTFSATDEKANKIETAQVLLLEGESGKAAVVTLRQYIRNKLIAGYKEAEKKGFFHFDTPLPCSELIGTNGQTKINLPLPNKENTNIGKKCGVGLTNNCISPELHSISYQKDEPSGYWVTFSAYSENTGEHRLVRVLFSDKPGVKGRKAILQQEIIGGSDKLPMEFISTSEDRTKNKQKKLENTELATVLQPTKPMPLVAKGLAFEQVVGVLLAALNPEASIIGQYCLQVEAKKGVAGSGIYRVRVDWCVKSEGEEKGKEKIKEVKWGNATSNINETYHKHAEHLDGRDYWLVMLKKNEEVPHYTLFSELAEKSELKDKLLELVAKLTEIENMALESSALNNEAILRFNAINRYLYSGLKESCKLKGAARIAALSSLIGNLLSCSDDKLTAFCDAKGHKHFFSGLEANFFWNGKLYSTRIKLKDLHSEDQHIYDTGFSFTDRLIGGTTWTFARKFDRDLRVMLELVEPKVPRQHPVKIVEGDRNAHGWFMKPKISLGGLKIPTPLVAPKTVTEMENYGIKLKSFLGEHGYVLKDEDITFAIEYCDEVGSRV